MRSNTAKIGAAGRDCRRIMGRSLHLDPRFSQGCALLPRLLAPSRPFDNPGGSIITHYGAINRGCLVVAPQRNEKLQYDTSPELKGPAAAASKESQYVELSPIHSSLPKSCR